MTEKAVGSVKYKIGSRIRKYREARGLSQKQLAARLGVSNSRVSNWEQGVNRPDADILADICTALEVSPSQLLDVRVTTDELTDEERRLVAAYRSKPDLRPAVRILLGMEET